MVIQALHHIADNGGGGNNNTVIQALVGLYQGLLFSFQTIFTSLTKLKSKYQKINKKISQKT